MRRLSKTLALVSLACASCATGLVAAPAAFGYTEFWASREPTPISEATPAPTRGRSPEGEFSQVLRFGAFEIKCNATTSAKTVGEGAITWETNPTFATEIKFKKCLTVAKFGSFTGGLHTQFNENKPMKILYHIKGFAEFGVGETETEAEVGGGEASFKIQGHICKIDWPAQTVPAKAVKDPEGEYSAAVYSNKEVPVEERFKKKYSNLIQNRLIIANEFKGMKWSYEEGQCVGEGGFEEEAKKTEEHDGKWTGTLEEEVVGGDLGVR